jgi:hypothetical protein
MNSGMELQRSTIRSYGRTSAALLVPLILQLFAVQEVHAQESPSPGPAPSCGQTLQVVALIEEVRDLRVLITTWKLEVQSERTKGLEQSLEAVRRERAQLQDEQRNAEQQLATVDAQIRNVAVGSEQYLQLEAEKALAASDTDAYRQRFIALGTREVELQQTLSIELVNVATLKTQLNSIDKLH